MTIYSFELMLQEVVDDDLTDEEFNFILEHASYMSDRDRIFFMNIIKKLVMVGEYV